MSRQLRCPEPRRSIHITLTGKLTRTALALAQSFSRKFLLLACAAMLAAKPSLPAETPIERQPHFREQTYITRSDRQPKERNYHAFPVVLQMSEDELWIAYKSGRSHMLDPGATIEVVSHHLRSGGTELIARLAPAGEHVYQSPELVRLPGGVPAIYIDVQANRAGKHARVGAESYRWDSATHTFTGPQPLGAVDGVTYGYPFDFIVEGTAVWQLIMSFEDLPGGRRSVDVLRSADAGETWHFVRDLTTEFGGIRANESAFVKIENEFVVATRGYDNRARLHRIDGAFHVQQQVDLTEQYPGLIGGTLGRPRLFIRDGKGYLLGRNSPPAAAGARRPMQLCLICFDLRTLAVTSYAVLDNASEESVTDGYYAVPVFDERDGRTVLHVITYKGTDGKPPDILRYDYLWDEVK